MQYFKKRSIQIVLVFIIAILVFVGVYFEPQSALFNKKGNDKKVGEMISNTKVLNTVLSTDEISTSSTIPELVKYTFNFREHETSGATYFTKDGEDIYLRLEDLKTTNGPDLKVYLATDVDSSGAPKEYISLGDLEANIGNSNYLVPAGTDITQYKYVVIWCERFSVSFGDSKLF